HCSYLEEVRLTDESVRGSPTRVHQLVMSPYRNPLHIPIRLVNLVARTKPAIALTRALARWRAVVEPAADWKVTDGPWFRNGVMTLVLDGRDARVEVDHAKVLWPLGGLGRFVAKAPGLMSRARGRNPGGGDAGERPRQVLRRTLTKALSSGASAGSGPHIL